MPLIPFKDVRDLLPQTQYSDDQLTAAMKLVAGWLRTATGLTELPELTEAHPLYSAAFELTVLTVTNPEQVQSRGFGPKTKTYPAAARRTEILEDVRTSWRRLSQQPSGCFPDPVPLPDPPALTWPVRYL